MPLAPLQGMDKATVDAVLELAEAALFNDDLGAASQLYQEVLRLDPRNTIARRGVDEVDRLVRRRVPSDRPIHLAVTVPQLLAEKLDSSEAFVMSRFTAGRMTLDQLTAHCPLPRIQVTEIVERFLEREVLAVG